MDTAEHIAPQLKETPTALRKTLIKVMTDVMKQDPKLGDRLSYWAELREEAHG